MSRRTIIGKNKGGEVEATHLFLGGDFTGTNQNRFAVINKSTKALVTGYPSFSQFVYSITQDEDNIYVGGSFTGTRKHYFNMINKSTKQLVFHTDFEGTINDLSLDGNLLYVGGNFTSPNQGFSVLDASDPLLTLQTGYPTLSSSGVVNKIEYDDKFIYLFGTFTNNKSTTTQYGRGLAIINKTNKLISYVYPFFSNGDANSTPATGKVLNGKVYAQIPIQNALYDINKSNGSFEYGYTTFQMPFSSTQDIFKIVRDKDYIYVGGSFTNTALPHYFVVLNKGTRQVEYRFNNFISGVTTGRQVNDITFDNSSIWTAWSLTTSTGQILGFDKATGLQITGYPAFNNIVTAIDNDDDFIYVGGNYTTPTPTRFTVVKKSDKLQDTSVTRPDYGGRIRTIKNDATRIYIGGDFTSPTAYFSILTKSTGNQVTGYSTFGNSVYVIALDEDNIYVGGNFTSPATRFTVLDKTTLATVSGYPSFNGIVWDIKVDERFIYVVGAFTDSGRARLTVIRKSDKAVVSGFPTMPSLTLNSVG